MPENPTLDPTPRLLRVAGQIKAGNVQHYHFTTPVTYYMPADQRVTAEVRKLVNADLADYGTPINELQRSIVALTPDGEQWLTEHGSSE